MITYILLAFLLLPFVYDLLFPLRIPSLVNYFHPGQTFIGKSEGLTQKVIRQEGGRVYCELIVSPGAAGPPEHLHLHFTESGILSKGTLRVKLNDHFIHCKEGDRLLLPANQFHTFCNESETEVVIVPGDNELDYMPVEFMYGLTQVYPFMDSDSKWKGLHLLMKLSLLGDQFDSYIAGPPVPMQKLIRRVLRPYARVLGYTLTDYRV